MGSAEESLTGEENRSTESSTLTFTEGEKVHHDFLGNAIVLAVKVQRDGNDPEEYEVVTVEFENPSDGKPKRLTVGAGALAHGWDEAEVGKTVSPTARKLKRELFGKDLSADDVAYILDLDRTTILRYLRDGTLVGYQVGREWRVSTDEVKEFKERMIAEKRRQAKHLAKVNEVERQRELLERSYPGRSWHTSMCTQCHEPLLMEHDSMEDNFWAACSNCGNHNVYDPPREQPTVVDNMPF